MRPPIKPSFRLYLPALFMCTVTYLVMAFARSRAKVLKLGHDFVPIYSEEGQLEGFTHPVLVQAGNKYREQDSRNASSS